MTAHKNNVGLLRLLFASLVIVGHAPELVDGDRSHEPLTLLFHTISLGDLSVDAFFLLSGYLITASWVANPTMLDYLKRRVLRIVPAFVLAYLLCVFLLGPLLSIPFWRRLPDTFAAMLALQPPPIRGNEMAAFPQPQLNGPMWTIAYEFRCYLLVLVFGLIGLFRQQWLVLALAVAALATHVYCTFHPHPSYFDKRIWFFGQIDKTARLTAIFLVGMCVYLFRNMVIPRLNAWIASACAVACAALLFEPHAAEVGVAIFGGTFLFWLALKAKLGPLQRINDRWDVSYGVYLYGWPIATAILWFDRTITPPLLGALSLSAAMVFGAVSWFGLERWVKNLGHRPPAPPAQMVA